MSKRDLLLEIGLEELPARFVTSSMEQLTDRIQKWLQEKAIEFGDVSAFSSPRRLAVLIKDVAESQRDINEEAKGPAKKIALDAQGNWSKAAIGFTRGQGVTVDDIFFKEIAGVEYVHVKKFIKGQPTFNLLNELNQIISSMTFPKNMRWANQELRFARPIKWIAALFGEEVIPFSLADVETGRITKGHRFLGEEISLSNALSYEEELKKQFVIVNPSERKALILEQLKQLEQENGWEIPVDGELLEEVTNLVEFPTALSGTFEEEFLELPEKVLITSMKEHQRYFPVKNASGELLPYFVTVRNGDDRNLKIVSKGNEKVLRARLSDASFFYKEDQKVEIETSLKKLESIVYHEELGTLAEKVSRVKQFTLDLSEALGMTSEEKEHAKRAAEISKFDLVTNMVYEFPELQGYMGERYARIKGEDEAVAAAVNEHYMPRHADDEVPPSIIGAVLSVAEKMDTISAFFSIGIIPSGSQDPYALRRQASGVVNILTAKKWRISVEELVEMAVSSLQKASIGSRDAEEVRNDILQFLKARVKHLLAEEGIRYDIADALLENQLGTLSSLVERAQVLESRKQDPDFKGNLEALSRVINLASKAEDTYQINEAKFENDFERALYNKFQSVSEIYGTLSTEAEKFNSLVSLKSEIEDFFEHTMVMSEDPGLRKNRLALLKAISGYIRQFAEMNKIIVS
ncbi:glycine--tRNA ligase subunit beta [Peribacillus saganii]|uniref:Glycine--tRNA ligase beta subunit n=1 Tax=Peribacillus saganii TaxID=2303992 RepID=A0A372LUE4_9BACI|nr:glycine--tRNA ligase subunit beta [Peribacillus saganii]RFU71696.1 glycine--tRNA ligase subunit beta [Peribacillus saganii]